MQHQHQCVRIMSLSIATAYIILLTLLRCRFCDIEHQKMASNNISKLGHVRHKDICELMKRWREVVTLRASQTAEDCKEVLSLSHTHTHANTLFLTHKTLCNLTSHGATGAAGIPAAINFCQAVHYIYPLYSVIQHYWLKWHVPIPWSAVRSNAACAG